MFGDSALAIPRWHMAGPCAADTTGITSSFPTEPWSPQIPPMRSRIATVECKVIWRDQGPKNAITYSFPNALGEK